MEMPPREPLVYRLYEIVQNYGYAYKAVLNEKFGDGIMSAISFSTKVEKETDSKGDWVVITLRGKWYVSWCETASRHLLLTMFLGFLSAAFDRTGCKYCTYAVTYKYLNSNVMCFWVCRC